MKLYAYEAFKGAESSASAPLKKFKVGFDIDDVLFPWYARAHEAAKEAGITNGVEPTTWYPYREYGCSREDWLEALEVVTLKGGLYLEHGPDEDAVRALRSLMFDGHEIHLITARGFIGHKRLIEQHTVRWLERYAIPYKTLSFTRQKGLKATQLGLDWFIDDNVENWQDVSQAFLRRAGGAHLHDSAWRSKLLDRPWNKDAVHFEGERVQSVQEYVDIIRAESNKEAERDN